MSQAIKLFVYPVSDVKAATDLFEKFLGTKPYVESPYYVGFRVGNQEVGLDPNGDKNGVTSPIGYVGVEDIKKSLKVLLDTGAKLHQDVKDVGGGRLIAQVQDHAGNFLGLIQDPVK